MSWSSLYIMRGPRIQLRLSGLVVKHLYLLSHFAVPENYTIMKESENAIPSKFTFCSVLYWLKHHHSNQKIKWQSL